jgi:hypothetical protein
MLCSFQLKFSSTPRDVNVAEDKSELDLVNVNQAEKKARRGNRIEGAFRGGHLDLSGLPNDADQCRKLILLEMRQ